MRINGEYLVVQLRELQRSGNLKEALNLIEQNPSIEFEDNVELRILYGIIQYLTGNQIKAYEVLSQLFIDEIYGEEAKVDYAFLLFLTGSKEKAIEYLKEVLRENPDSFIAHARLGNIYLLEGKYDEAERHFVRALDLQPEKVELIANYATLLSRQGRYEEALEMINRAIRLAPERVELFNIKSNILVGMDRVEDLVEEMYERIRANPEEKVYYLNLALALLNVGREDEAVAVISGALDKFEADESIKIAFIKILLRAERNYLLGTKLKEWVELEPESYELRFYLNQARIECGFLETAEEDLEKFPEELKEEPQWKMLKAKIYLERNRVDEAIKLLEEVVERFPGHVEARSQLAHTLLSIGKVIEAREHIEVVDSLCSSVTVQKVQYFGYRAEEEEIRELKKLKDDLTLPVNQRASAAFTLAMVYEKRGEYDRSFETVIEANELMKNIVRYDWREHRRYVQRIIRAFDRDTIQRLRGKGHPSTRPIFIVGMPRSGTTLVEQIISSHSKVYGAGELPWIGKIITLFPETNGGYPYPEGIHYMDERHLVSAAEYYLEKLDLYNKEAEFVTDKLPHNFLHLGLIHLMFPRAKIIHLRRDPRDVAVSNYYQNFAALRGTIGYAYDLRDIGHMLNDHDRIMKHWHSVLPGVIREVVYEELVEDPERVIRELLEYLELPWEESVMQFYELRRPVKTASIQQVRESIYKESKHKWMNYQKYLEPLLKILEEGFVPVD